MRSIPAARLLLLVLAAGIVPACTYSGARTPTTNPVLFEGAGSLTLKAASFSGRQEVPPNASSGAGSATVEVDQSHMFLQVTVNHGGLTDITEAHIHAGVPGVDGPIIFSLASGPFTSPLVVTLTSTNLLPSVAAGINSFTDALNALARGQCYVNIHTAAFTGGEIRGQVGPVTLQATLDGTQVVPPIVTPSTGTMTLQLNNDQTLVNFVMNTTASNVTFAHIHAGAPGVQGGILFTLGFAPNVPSQAGTLTAANFAPQAPAIVTTFEAAVDAMISGNAYVDVHTLSFPDGELRGQIQGTVVSIPPPTTNFPPTTPPGITPPSTIIVIPPY